MTYNHIDSQVFINLKMLIIFLNFKIKKIKNRRNRKNKSKKLLSFHIQNGSKSFYCNIDIQENISMFNII